MIRTACPTMPIDILGHPVQQSPRRPRRRDQIAALALTGKQRIHVVDGLGQYLVGTAVGDDDFYFIYKSKAVILKDKIASYELIPVGFIHNQDEEYYYSSFDGNCLGYEDIVKKFVEECLI